MAKTIKKQISIEDAPTGTLEMVSDVMQRYIDEAKRYRIRALAAKNNVDRIAFEDRAKECEKKAKEVKDRIFKSCAGIQYATNQVSEIETL